MNTHAYLKPQISLISAPHNNKNRRKQFATNTIIAATTTHKKKPDTSNRNRRMQHKQATRTHNSIRRKPTQNRLNITQHR